MSAGTFPSFFESDGSSRLLHTAQWPVAKGKSSCLQRCSTHRNRLGRATNDWASASRRFRVASLRSAAACARCCTQPLRFCDQHSLQPLSNRHLQTFITATERHGTRYSLLEAAMVDTLGISITSFLALQNSSTRHSKIQTERSAKQPEFEDRAYLIKPTVCTRSSWLPDAKETFAVRALHGAHTHNCHTPKQLFTDLT